MLSRSKSIVLSLFFLLSTAVLANEGKQAEGSAGGGEAPQDKASQERTKEWMELSAQISSLKTKIGGKEEAIKEAIKHKQHATSKADAEHAVQTLLKEHGELKKLEEEYNEKTQLMKYRYPEVGITEKRKYERIKVKSLEDYEQMMSLEGEVKKSVIKIKEHYGIKDLDEEVNATKEPKDDPEENNKLSKPIIIRK
jgi:hypothetical protein